MSEKDITKFLQALGFSKREVQIYMFLAKSGVQSTSFVAKRLKMERVQAYRTFKKLQEKGFIEATLERPTRFTVVPFEKLLETFIETRKSEVTSLNEQKDALVSAWRAVSAPESEYAVAKFSIITGKKKIHLKMLNMVEEAKKGILVLTSGPGLIQEDLAGVFDDVEHPVQKRSVPLKILTEISPENLKIVERMDKKFSAGKADIECHHMLLDSKAFPSFLIKDDEEAILYAMSGGASSMLTLEEEGLWINDRMFALFKGSIGQHVTAKFDAVETINASSFPFRSASSKAEKLAERFGLPRVAGTDAHYGPVIGCAYTVIDSELNVESILKAIVDGRCEPAGGSISLRMRIQNQGRFFKKYLKNRGRRAS